MTPINCPHYFMSIKISRTSLLVGVILFCCMTTVSHAQFITDDLTDTTKYQQAMIGLYQKFNRLRFTGYIQPQFQTIQTKGAANFSGGDFQAGANNRFMLRRGRLRLDYTHLNKAGNRSVFFVFQFDGTERGVFIRDFFGRFFDTRWNLFNITTGMFPRPFGFEVNLGSADRESPERGRMSQILMRTERDLGFMASFEPLASGHPLSWLKIDIGLFNGQGLAGTADFDSHKDLIARINARSLQIFKKRAILSFGASVLYGGMEQFTSQRYTMKGEQFQRDSSTKNIGTIAPRHYYGFDAQLKFPLRKKGMATEFRAEYISGQQTGTQNTTETPGSIPTANGTFAPLYVRPFSGGYFYFLQHIGSPKHQLGFKYDYYDPNRGIAGSKLSTGFTTADLRFDTFSIGYNYYINENLRWLIWYDIIRNEKSGLKNYENDFKDNVLTCRMQYRF
jgi:hypothetical protein